MNPERWRRVDALFAEALELDDEARTLFLERCDADVRDEVATMVEYARASERFLEREEESEPRRFIAGDIVAGRYRIASLLGRGGMGDVYHADDLKLGQPVALKFLSGPHARDGAALARFHREVSLARQISHRHVCRVYDIGEHAGMHFLTMEYVRGETLSSLLERIGHLPHDKAVAAARQLCAGVAAIHAAGVLHRDLKPGNVMIDEHGDVRITDFGVASSPEDARGSEILGTPVYMAPEQLAGGELTVRSDLYALGIVLHEMFTGTRPRDASLAGVDPIVARVIGRCLQDDPRRRPATALQVAAALPGGNPLAAALAAGETPSPQMVAAAAAEGSLRPWQAMLLFAAIVAGIVLTAFWSRRSLHRFIALDVPPEILRARAAEIARDAGYTRVADSAWGMRADYAAIDYVTAHAGWNDFRRHPLPAIAFWYRQSPRALEVIDGPEVDDRQPAALAGTVTLRLDTSGRLLYFDAAPPQQEARAAAAPDWNAWFARAGLSAGDFHPTPSQWTPPHYADARFAWSNGARRIEAASYRGAPVYFEVIGPWQKPLRDSEPLPFAPFSIVLLVFYFGAIALASALAWRNLRLGRGDRRGTFRLVLFIFVVRMLYWIVAGHHTASASEVQLVVAALTASVYWSVLIGALYLAIEPFVRRRWPEGLIAWSRVLAGELRDPLAGSHILIGGVLGIAGTLAAQLFRVLAPLRSPASNSSLLITHGLRGTRGFLPLLLNQTAASILFSLILTALLRS